MVKYNYLKMFILIAISPLSFLAKAVAFGFTKAIFAQSEKTNFISSLIEEATKMKLLLKEVLNLNKAHIDPIKPKELIADRYEIKDPIGSGAAGNIHVVYDTRTGEKFALKTLREGIYSKKELRRFIREANAMATLSHPNIVTIENLGWDKNRPFIVMEYVEGGNFKTILEKFHSGEINLNTLLFYFADICEGLRYLHERPNPIVHRDLKPQNILISNETTDDDGSVRNVLKITDFGLIHLDTESTILVRIVDSVSR